VPTAAPTPAATPKPTLAPTNGLNVPASIDATGSRDVSSELSTFIRNAPDGSTIVFKAGGTYRLGEVLKLRGRKGITLEGNGATLKLTGPDTDSGFYASGIFVEGLSEDITIRDLTIIGNHATAGTSDACCGREGQHGIATWGARNVLIERVDISRVGGDCFNINEHDGRVWSDGVTVQDSVCRLTGRMGVHFAAGKNVRFLNNTFDDIGYAVFASEPNDSTQGASNLVMRGNTIGSYGLTDKYYGELFYACDAPWGGGATVRDVTITDNTVEGNRGGMGDSMRGLHVWVCDNGPRANFTITNNTAGKAVSGPAMRISGVNGVTITGNTQPLSSGELASIRNSTAVTYR
jgi:hypothetical protein